MILSNVLKSIAVELGRWMQKRFLKQELFVIWNAFWMVILCCYSLLCIWLKTCEQNYLFESVFVCSWISILFRTRWADSTEWNLAFVLHIRSLGKSPYSANVVHCFFLYFFFFEILKNPVEVRSIIHFPFPIFFSLCSRFFLSCIFNVQRIRISTKCVEITAFTVRWPYRSFLAKITRLNVQTRYNIHIKMNKRSWKCLMDVELISIFQCFALGGRHML